MAKEGLNPSPMLTYNKYTDESFIQKKMWDVSSKKKKKSSSEFKGLSITAVASGFCISSCSRVPSTAMMPWWAIAGDGRVICFGNYVSLFTKRAVSFLRVTYANQTMADEVWKVRK